MSQPGDRVTVKAIVPPVHPLRDGLKAGDVVKLIKFDCGYWSVERESDGQASEIYMENIDRTL